MNGRIYDPVIARMLSADPTIPNPSDLQAYNRYSYVLNNPLRYTDPSGFRSEEEKDQNEPVENNEGGGDLAAPIESEALHDGAEVDGVPLRDDSIETNDEGYSEGNTEYKERITEVVPTNFVTIQEGFESEEEAFSSMWDSVALGNQGESFIDRANGFLNSSFAQGAALMAVGFIPGGDLVGTGMDAYDLTHSDSKFVRGMAGVSLAANGLSFGVSPNLAPVRRGAAKMLEGAVDFTQMALRGTPSAAPGDMLKFATGQVGEKADEFVDVYRVFGDDARAQGFSWTTTDPRSVDNFRDLAGLPSGGASDANNSADFLIQGKAKVSDILDSRSALPLDGNRGGLPELIIDPKNVDLTDFSVLNP